MLICLPNTASIERGECRPARGFVGTSSFSPLLNEVRRKAFARPGRRGGDLKGYRIVERIYLREILQSRFPSANCATLQPSDAQPRFAPVRRLTPALLVETAQETRVLCPQKTRVLSPMTPGGDIGRMGLLMRVLDAQAAAASANSLVPRQNPALGEFKLRSSRDQNAARHSHRQQF